MVVGLFDSSITNTIKLTSPPQPSQSKYNFPQCDSMPESINIREYVKYRTCLYTRIEWPKVEVSISSIQTRKPGL